MGEIELQSDGELEPKLSAEEKKTLAKYERTIKKGWDTFLEVGRALAAIRDQNLYREQYKTFAAYCRERWNYGRAHAYRLIGAAEVWDELSPMGDTPTTPVNERQLRPLIDLPPDSRRQAWESALEAAGEGPLSEKHVRNAVKALQGGSQPEAPKRPATSIRKATVSDALQEIDQALAQEDIATARRLIAELQEKTHA